jgi:hypothetical protein
LADRERPQDKQRPNDLSSHYSPVSRAKTLRHFSGDCNFLQESRNAIVRIQRQKEP